MGQRGERCILKICSQRESIEEPKEACGLRPGKKECLGSLRKVRQGSEYAGPGRPWEATDSLNASVSVFEGLGWYRISNKYFGCHTVDQLSM